MVSHAFYKIKLNFPWSKFKVADTTKVVLTFEAHKYVMAFGKVVNITEI